MKKIFTLSLGLALCVSASADSVKILGLGLGTPGYDEPQFMGLGISPNGRYVCGAIQMGDGYFVGDLDNNEYSFDVTDDPEGAELRNVNNDGVAIGYSGPGITYSISGVETILQTPAGNYKYVLGEDLTNDGSIMVGSLVAKGYATYAAYCKDGGEWIKLPGIDNEEGEESSAKYVSGDGKVILGHYGSFGAPMLWKMNDEGEYEVDPIISNYLDSSENAGTLYSLFPNDLSENGKYVVCRGMMLTEDAFRYVPVVYNVDDQTFTVYDEEQPVDILGIGLTPSAIDNEGTIIGIIGEPLNGSAGSFVIKSGETQAVSLGEAYPAFGETFGPSDSMGYCVPTDMSADGRYIVGYGWYTEDFYDEFAEAYFATFVIDTQSGTSSVKISTVEENETVPAEFYSIDGKRLGEMTKGLNIVKMSDGTVRKVFKK